MAAGNFSAPVMEIGKLVELAKTMIPDIRLTEADIKSPRSMHIIYLYEEVLTDLRVNLDSVRLAHWQALPSEYSEGFEEALPLVRLGKFIENFMAKIGITDFMFRDIINPQPKRTRRFLSALFNFWNFAESQTDAYNEIAKKASHAKEEQLRQQSVMEQTKRQINEIKKKTIEEEPACLQLQEEIDKKRVELQQLLAESKSLKEKFANIKLRSTEIASSNADLALKIQKAKQGNSNLASQIVNSPGRLKEEVAQARQRLESLQELKCQLQLRHQELMQYSEELKQTKAILGTFNENMNCIATELDKERELEMKLKEIRTLNKRLQRQLREGQTQNDDHQEQLSSRRERLAAVDLQLATKTMALQQKLKTVLREAEIVEQFQTECDIATSVIEQETEQLNKEIKEVTQQADEADADISGQLCEVLSAVDEFNQRSTAELLALESRLIARNKRAEELIKKLEMLDVDADDFVIDFVV